MPPRRQARSASRLDRKSVHFPCSLGGRAWPMIPPRIRLLALASPNVGARVMAPAASLKPKKHRSWRLDRSFARSNVW